MNRKSVIVVLSFLAVSSFGANVKGDERPLCSPPPVDRPMMLGAAEALLFAQGPGGEGMMRRGGGPRMPMEGMKHRKHLEQLRILKMLELLDLSKEQEVPFLTAFNSMREDLRGFEEQANQLTDTLASALQSDNSEESRLRSLIGRIKDVERRKYDRLMAFVDQAETMLTAEQVGKLLIFQKRFEAELLEQVGRFRRGIGNPPGPGSPEGEG